MNRRLATPGALLMLAGVAILYWGLGIFRGETSGAIAKRFVSGGMRERLGGTDIADEHSANSAAAPPRSRFGLE